MLVVVTSDSHGRSEILKSIYQKYPQAFLYLDAGDSCTSEGEIFPFLSVRGNRDYLVENLFRIETAGKLRIFVFHGHRHSLAKDYLVTLAKNNNCQMIIHGHTHVPYYLEQDGIHLLCPGSVSSPRSRHGTTYALVKIADKVEVFFKKVK